MSRRVADPETGLTPSQETFCVELARTGNASEAYRIAYNATRMKPETITRRASDLTSDSRIAARLSVLRAEVRKTSGITLSDHLRTLQTLRQEARAAKQYAAAITAEVSRGKVSGLYNEADPDAESAPIHHVKVTLVDGRKA